MMKIELENVLPREIEKRSFELITEELGERTFPEEQEPIIKRCIHTSADFDYADNLCFSEGVVEKAKEAIRNGACIVTDTQMAKSGINKKKLAAYGEEKRDDKSNCLYGQGGSHEQTADFCNRQCTDCPDPAL